MDAAWHAAEIGQVVVDEGQRRQSFDRLGLRAARAVGVSGGDDALDRKALGAEVAQPGRLEAGLERGDADEFVPGVV